MKGQAFQSYTPRCLPLNYDSLDNIEGCQPVSGTDYYAFKAFDTFCVFDHDEANPIFNQPLTTSWCQGPAVQMVPDHFLTRWSFWVGDIGVRGGPIFPVTPPANNLGQPSSLYPKTKPLALSGAFDRNAMLTLAVQLDDSTIEIKRYTTAVGNAQTYPKFTGYSPCMVATHLVSSGPDESGDDMVCLYLREELPNSIFARFQRDDYAIEKVIHENLPRNLTQLIGVVAQDFKFDLYARDSAGLDITLHSPAYGALAGRDEMNLSMLIESGLYGDVAVEADLPLDFATLSVVVASGNYFDAMIEIATPPTESATLTCEIAGGSYDLAT